MILAKSWGFSPPWWSSYTTSAWGSSSHWISSQEAGSNEWMQLLVSFSFIRGRVSIRLCYTYSECAFLISLTQSRNFLTVMARGLSPRWFYILPNWQWICNINCKSNIHTLIANPVYNARARRSLRLTQQQLSRGFSSTRNSYFEDPKTTLSRFYK